MAQPKLEYISLAVARLVGDEILNMTASSDGNTYTATQRINAINSARQNIYLALLSQLQSEEKFAEEYPEFVKESSRLDVTSNVAEIPDNAKYILSAKIKAGRVGDAEGDDYKPAGSLPKGSYYESKYNENSPYHPIEGDYKYFENGNSVIFLGTPFSDSSARFIYLEDIVPVSLGGADDIPDPFSWRQKTIDEAARILTADEQSKLKI